MNEFLTHFIQSPFDTPEWGILISRFAMNLFFVYIIVKMIYFRVNKRREFLFTFFLTNIAIFSFSSILSTVHMGTGFAFGLFAVFSMLRYRADTIDIKEMTVLFVCTVVAVINSLVTREVSIYMILTVNIFITAASFILEAFLLKNAREQIDITYENIDLVSRDKKDQLLAALQKRTGLQITDVQIHEVNYLNDSAKLTVYYKADE
ncbi:MAG: DUF4956 domain-containing protein [Fibrobacterota bacterium]